MSVRWRLHGLTRACGLVSTCDKADMDTAPGTPSKLTTAGAQVKTMIRRMTLLTSTLALNTIGRE